MDERRRVEHSGGFNTFEQNYNVLGGRIAQGLVFAGIAIAIGIVIAAIIIALAVA